MRKLLLIVACLATFSACSDRQVSAGDLGGMIQVWAHNFAMDRPWHGAYYAQRWGQPTAVVVPPTAHMQQNYSWGVSQNLMYPIHHQFGRSATAPGAAARGSFLPTPPWPSHTDQFGYYYVRAPWGHNGATCSGNHNGSCGHHGNGLFGKGSGCFGGCKNCGNRCGNHCNGSCQCSGNCQ